MKWPTVCLGEVATIVGGSTPLRSREEFWNGDIPWVTPTDLPMLGEGIPAVTGARERITAEGLAACSAQLLPVGTVLFSSRATIGKLGISKVLLATNQGFANFIPKPWIDARFLGYSLQYHTPSIANLAGKTTFKEVSKGALRHYRILLPPLSEQRRIVEILDQADALRKKRGEADAKTDRVFPALFYKIFGDPATNPNGWEMVSLGKLSVDSPQYGANAKAIDWFEGMPRYVRITDIREDGFLHPGDIKTLELGDWQPYALQEGDLLFARSGATVGKTYLYQSDDGLCAFAGYLIRFKIDQSQIDPWVVFALTQTPYYEGWVSSKKRTAAQPNINGQEYASLLIPKPTKDLQQNFAGAAKHLVKLRGRRSRMRDELESTFLSLLYVAFSGDLTAQWREGHMNELLAEMEEQAKYLADLGPKGQQENAARQESLF